MWARTCSTCSSPASRAITSSSPTTSTAAPPTPTPRLWRDWHHTCLTATWSAHAARWIFFISFCLFHCWYLCLCVWLFCLASIQLTPRLWFACFLVCFFVCRSLCLSFCLSIFTSCIPCHLIIAHNLNRRCADAKAVEGLASHLSDSYLVGSRRKVNTSLFVCLFVLMIICLSVSLSFSFFLSKLSVCLPIDFSVF